MRKVFLWVFAGVFTVAYLSGSLCYAGKTEAVSVDSAGKLGNGNSSGPAISTDGRYVAFASAASNLVPGDTNGKSNIFVHDRQTGETKIISKDSAGKLGDNDSIHPAISAAGRYVAFQSMASNLVPGETNGYYNIFVHDRQTGETKIIGKDSAGKLGNNDRDEPAISADGRYVVFRSMSGGADGIYTIFVHDRQTNETKVVSVNSAGTLGNGHSEEPAISADGRYMAFKSAASNLVPGDANGKEDIFVHDRQTGKTIIVSKNSAGTLGNGNSNWPAISSDGRYVAFRSAASNLVPGKTNGYYNIFVHDRQTGKTKIVSKASNGKPANGSSDTPSISADGRYVAFQSKADNLVPGDKNGKADAFVYDRRTGKTEIVSVSSNGIQGNSGRCFVPVISADGTYVAFESDSSNLVPGRTSDVEDILVRDRR